MKKEMRNLSSLQNNENFKGNSKDTSYKNDKFINSKKPVISKPKVEIEDPNFLTKGFKLR